MRKLILAACLAAIGCTPAEPDEDVFPRHAAQRLCSLERQCARGMWQNAYFGQADCLDHWEYELQRLVELMDDLDCDYDKKEAGKAIEKLSEMDCEDWYEDVFEDQGTDLLDEVWDECGNNFNMTGGSSSGR